MSDQLRWNYSLNAGLIFGSKQPPATLVTPQNRRGIPLETLVDAAVPFKGTSYMNRQGGDSARSAYMNYLRRMIALVDVSAKGGSTEDEARSDAGSATLRMVGVVTQLNDPHAMEAASRNAPWEFYQITDASDDDQLLPVLEALSVSRPDLTIGVGNADGGGGGASSEYVSGRLSLFCGKVTHFTGLYPGAVVGVVGTPCRRDLEGRLTSVLVSELILPRRVLPRAAVDRPLATTTHAPAIPRQAARIMYVSGPYPRRAVAEILKSAVDNAVQRHATLLIIGGPLLVAFEESERAVVMAQTTLFSDQVEAIVLLLETHLDSVAQTNPHARALRFLLVPALDDATQIPVLPQTQYGIETASESPVIMGTNPCRVTHAGITIGILQHDAISDMRERMVERMQGREEGSLHRVVETLIASRLYMPMFEFPNRMVDSKHLASLSLCGGAPASKDAPDDATGETHPSSAAAVSQPPYEDIPHLIFIPSSKPQFAFACRTAADGPADDATSGPVVINPMVWNHRNKRQKHFLNIVEVTVPDTAHAARFGLAHRESDVAVSVFSAYRE